MRNRQVPVPENTHQQLLAIKNKMNRYNNILQHNTDYSEYSQDNNEHYRKAFTPSP